MCLNKVLFTNFSFIVVSWFYSYHFLYFTKDGSDAAGEGSRETNQGEANDHAGRSILLIVGPRERDTTQD